jgi:hypothetical protein
METISDIPQTDVLLARRELALTRRALELRKANALQFYNPHPKQQLFHNAADYHYRYARTGNRFGKSEMGAAEDIAFALGYRPWIPEGDERRTRGIPQFPTKGLIVTTDWDKSTEVFTEVADGPTKGKLFKYIPKASFINAEKNHSGAIDTLRVKHITGGVSVIRLDTVKSFKQNPLGSESGDNDWVHIDEPIPVEMYNAIIRGLIDRDGRVWFTCTPLTEPWIDEKFLPDQESQTKAEMTHAHGDFWMMTGTSDDNPHNTPEAIERVMSQYPEEEQETRRSGTPKAYFGLVYGHCFDWPTHVRKETPLGWDCWQRPPTNYTKRFAIDYHPRKPHHVLFIATSPDEYHFVYHEIFLDCLMEELVAEIRLVFNLSEPTVPGLIDPLSETPNRVTDLSPFEEVIRLGLPVLPATKDPHNGILAVKTLLKARDRMGNPVMVFNSNLRRTLMEISRGYIWDGETNKPLKKNDDAMENLYRLALQGLEYVEPASINDYRSLPPRDYSNVVIRPNEFRSPDYFEETRQEEKRARFASRYRR